MSQKKGAMREEESNEMQMRIQFAVAGFENGRRVSWAKMQLSIKLKKLLVYRQQQQNNKFWRPRSYNRKELNLAKKLKEKEMNSLTPLILAWWDPY